MVALTARTRLEREPRCVVPVVVRRSLCRCLALCELPAKRVDHLVRDRVEASGELAVASRDYGRSACVSLAHRLRVEWHRSEQRHVQRGRDDVTAAAAKCALTLSP